MGDGIAGALEWVLLHIPDHLSRRQKEAVREMIWKAQREHDRLRGDLIRLAEYAEYVLDDPDIEGAPSLTDYQGASYARAFALKDRLLREHGGRRGGA